MISYAAYLIIFECLWASVWSWVGHHPACPTVSPASWPVRLCKATSDLMGHGAKNNEIRNPKKPNTKQGSFLNIPNSFLGTWIIASPLQVGETWTSFVKRAEYVGILCFNMLRDWETYLQKKTVYHRKKVPADSEEAWRITQRWKDEKIWQITALTGITKSWQIHTKCLFIDMFYDVLLTRRGSSVKSNHLESTTLWIKSLAVRVQPFRAKSWAAPWTDPGEWNILNFTQRWSGEAVKLRKEQDEQELTELWQLKSLWIFGLPL